MRELIYLSEAKLRQFAVGRSRKWFGRARLEGEIKIPGVGGLKVGPAAEQDQSTATPNLEKVISALKNSDRAAAWFTDDAVQPGDWVHFEAPLNYTAIGEAVVFLDLDQSTPGYPTGSAVRLMLHGSLEHLIGHAPQVPRDLPISLGMSALPVRRLLDRLTRDLAFAEERIDFAEHAGDDTRDLHQFDLSTRALRIVQELGRQLELEYTAAWMAGYARITALLPLGSRHRMVMATPLYVEYVRHPTDTASRE